MSQGKPELIEAEPNLKFSILAWPPRKIVAGTLVVVATVVAFAFAYLFERAILCLLIGIVLDIALTPFIARLNNYGVPRSASVTIVYMTLGLGILLLAVFSTPMLIEQTGGVIDKLPDSYVKLRERLVSTSSERINRIAMRLPETWPPVELNNDVGAELSATVSTDEPMENFIGRSLYLTLGVVLLAFYWSLHGPRTIAAAILLLPDERRNDAREVVAEIQTRVGAFIRGQGVLCLIVGVLSFIAYWWIGLPYALLLAAVAGVTEMIPYFGPTLGSVPAILTALTLQPDLALWTLGACILVQAIENNILVPRIMGQSVGVHPVGIVLAMLCFGTLLGGIGIVVAIPFAAVLQILVERYLLRDESAEVPISNARDRVGRLRYEANDLIQDVRQQLRKKDEPVADGMDNLEDEIESIAMELERELAGLDEEREQVAVPS